MRASEFARKRARINRQGNGRPAAYTQRAMEHLVRDAEATPLKVGHRVVAWALPDGAVVCVKQRLRDGIEAFAELQRIAEHTPRGHHIPIGAYRCQFCEGWHLTSQEAKNH